MAQVMETVPQMTKGTLYTCTYIDDYIWLHYPQFVYVYIHIWCQQQ